VEDGKWIMEGVVEERGFYRKECVGCEGQCEVMLFAERRLMTCTQTGMRRQYMS
jgi:hypothetical protein